MGISLSHLDGYVKLTTWGNCFVPFSQEIERELRNSDRTNELLRRELGRLRQFAAHIMREHEGASEAEAKLAYLAWVQNVSFDAFGARYRFIP